MPELFQNPFINLIFLITGFYALTKGADLLVTGVGSLARRWGISSLVIGLTIVAFGTSAPEFFVNITSSFQKTNGITIGNVIGSNLANILLGIGIIAIIKPISIGRSTAWKEIPFLVLATFLFWSNASDHIIDGATAAIITRSEAFMLLGLFALFMVYTFGISKVTNDADNEEIPLLSFGKSLGLFLIGLTGLTLGGQVVVSAATQIARTFGMSETLIGITIIAVGTSIPDIITTIVAAGKKNVGLAVGNIIGSNIFNILWVLAISALIHPIPVETQVQPDIIFTFGITFLLFLAFNFTKFSSWQEFRINKCFSFQQEKYQVARWEGILFVLLYIGYMVFLVLRG